MSENNPLQKKSFSPDWLVRGVLTKLGDTFDRLTGRGWKPSSSLATSELIERLKKLLDSEIRENNGEGRFVPHNIKLKMQWDKFSTDSDATIAKLENELLAAAIDHINDNLYHTYAPLKLEVKPDYFTAGVKLLASFDNFAEEEHEAELNVTVPGMNIAVLIPEKPAETLISNKTFIAEFAAGAGPKSLQLVFAPNQRKSVGRASSSDLAIDDHSVSKIHATLALNQEGQLMVADTGSTNGTFMNGERISYGKAYPVTEADVVKFGLVEVRFERGEDPAPVARMDEDTNTEDAITVGEFEFRKKAEISGYPDTIPIEEGEVDAPNPIPMPNTASDIPLPISFEDPEKNVPTETSLSEIEAANQTDAPDSKQGGR